MRDSGMVVTIDVKASATRADLVAGNKVHGDIDRHFVVLVGYEGQIGNLKTEPRVG